MCYLCIYGFYVSNEFNEFNNEFMAPICRASILCLYLINYN